MQLTKFSLIALRVMMAVSRHPKQVVSTSDLLQELGGSYNHLVKVVHSLVKSEVLVSVRGRNGGVSLSLDPQNITLGRLVKETETVTTIIDCESASCPLVPDCNLRVVLNKANMAFYNALESTRLSDVI